MTRPELSHELTEDEFRRWYWTMAELQPFARAAGLGSSGPKAALADRIADRLAGRSPAPVQPPERTRACAQLTGELTGGTVIPVGQRSTTELRTFFEREIGQAFRFNGHMRAFLIEGGATLADAVQHWHQTVGTPLPKQSASLEFNAFTKAWHAEHPDGSAPMCRAAWERYRSLPKDERPPVRDA